MELNSKQYFEITQKLFKYLTDLYNAPTSVLKELHAKNFRKTLEKKKFLKDEFGNYLGFKDPEINKTIATDEKNWQNYLNAIDNINYNGDPNLFNDYSRAVMNFDNDIIRNLYFLFY